MADATERQAEAWWWEAKDTAGKRKPGYVEAPNYLEAKKAACRKFGLCKRIGDGEELQLDKVEVRALYEWEIRELRERAAQKGRAA